MTNALHPHSVRPLTENEFRLFQEFVYRESGIFLGPSKRALVASRLSKRLRALKLSNYSDYFKLAVGGNDLAEQVELLNAISTNETHFFREPRQFDFLREQIVPAIRNATEKGAHTRTLKVWSAACSTGEEPYSLAMLFLEMLPAECGWTIEILASDISTRVLAQAERGIWSLSKSHEIPSAYLKKWMLRGVGSQEGKMKAGPALRGLIEFRRINLSSAAEYPAGFFDLIFCRNVLIYFSAESKREVIRRLSSKLSGNGHLFMGHAETLHGLSDELRCVGPAIYRRISP